MKEEIEKHGHDHGCSCGSTIIQEKKEGAWKAYIPASISLVMLLLGIALDHYITNNFFTGYFRIVWYSLAYLPVGIPVMKEAWESIKANEYFTEFTLMVVATLGAFAIKEYPEGVAVMLFYTIGELFQDSAVNKAKRNIKALLDVRPSSASVFRNNAFQTVDPEDVKIGETIQIKVGEKVSLDGSLISESGSFNTSALTGESKPKTIRQGESVLAGMLNLHKVIEVKVEKAFSDSSLAKILEMVQDAASRKAKTELLIRKFAKIYTPIVFLLALLVVAIPYLIVDDYIFRDWLYRALVFLVISCPCALVISIPLGYFGGIGAASRHGILFKGSNYLDLMTKVNTVVMDKTGTLTHGVFEVQDVQAEGIDKDKLVNLAAALEEKSTHPIAKAIVEYNKNAHQGSHATNVEEISGYGLKGIVDGSEVLAGNAKLMQKYNIIYPEAIDFIIESIVVLAVDNRYAGYITIADEIKEDAVRAITEMKRQGVEQTVMLSGDKDTITQKIAKAIGIDLAYGNLLPEGKVQHLENIKADPSRVVAFVGDGINDAPVLALSDIGIAMGGMGSDAAIETADVVIQTDQPSKIATAIQISKATKSIVMQNIFLAFAIKLIVLILGAGGLATMWEAVFADVGVALLAILNAMRIQSKKFD